MQAHTDHRQDSGGRKGRHTHQHIAACAVLTVVCMRLHEREKREKNNETDKEGNAP